eukprot:2715377-Prymnesium_polylepis.1
MPSSSRHRSLPRPNWTKRPVRRVRSATRRYPETPPGGTARAAQGSAERESWADRQRRASMSVAQITDQTNCGRAGTNLKAITC